VAGAPGAGLSEARLEAIQKELAAIDLLSPLAGTFEMERIDEVSQEVASFGHHSGFG
jgi:hypothetical protein